MGSFGRFRWDLGRRTPLLPKRTIPARLPILWLAEGARSVLEFIGKLALQDRLRANRANPKSIQLATFFSSALGRSRCGLRMPTVSPA